MTATATHTQGLACPKCGGSMWDNRGKKTNPKAPDFKCKDRGCDGVIWPPKNGAAPTPAPTSEASTAPKKALSQMYTESLSFVLKAAVPLMKEAGIEVNAQAVSTMTATIFIARRDEER